VTLKQVVEESSTPAGRAFDLSIQALIALWLVRGLAEEDGGQELAERSPTLAAAQAASVQGRLGLRAVPRAARDPCRQPAGQPVHPGPSGGLCAGRGLLPRRVGARCGVALGDRAGAIDQPPAPREFALWSTASLPLGGLIRRVFG